MNRGEQPSRGRSPDSEPGSCVDPNGGCAPGDERVQTAQAFDVRPKGGARCVSSARRDLRGGCRETGIPTANIEVRSPDRTGLCCAGRSMLSQCEMVTGPNFSSLNLPDQKRTTASRDSSGPKLRQDASCAIIVSEWEELSGESRSNGGTTMSDLPQHCCGPTVSEALDALGRRRCR